MIGGFRSSRAISIVTPTRCTRLPGYRSVIKNQFQPVGSIVANFTSVVSGNVVRTFPEGNSIIVAVFTGINRFIVCKRQNNGQPSPGVVTSFTSIAGIWVSGRFVPAAVTTACHAISNNCLVMGKRQNQGQPVCNGMAALAEIRRLRMIRSFA